MSSALTAFQDAFHFAGLSLSLRTRRNNFTAGTNDWIQCQAPPSAPNLLAVMLEASVAWSATASSTVVANTDILDGWFSQLEIAPASATPSRIFLKTRKGAEEYERLCLDTPQSKAGDSTSTPYLTAPSAHIGSYARVATVAFTASGTRTDTSEYWAAIGGPAMALRLTIAALGTTWTTAANLSATYTIGFFEVYSIYTGTIAAFENKTATLASGNNQDMMALNVYPAGIACSLVSIVGESTTDVTAVYMTDATGGYIVNMDDTQSINATPYVYPRFATAVPSYSALIYYLHETVPTQFRISLANSVALDFLWIQAVGPDVAASTPPVATPAPPEVQRKGSPQPSNTGGQTTTASGTGGTAAGATNLQRPGGAAGQKGRVAPKWS